MMILLPSGLMAVAGLEPSTYGIADRFMVLVEVLVQGVADWARKGETSAMAPNVSGPLLSMHCWLVAQAIVLDPLRDVTSVVGVPGSTLAPSLEVCRQFDWATRQRNVKQRNTT